MPEFKDMPKARPGRKSSAESSRPLTAATRKPRASGLSRERIITETLRYLREHPDEPLTTARAGAAVGATSMAIYRHFRDGAALSDALLAKVLEGLDDEICADTDWRVQVRAWMEGVYRRFIATPQAVHMLRNSYGPSVSWVRGSIALQRSLAAGGLHGPQLADGVFWIGVTVSGFVQGTLATPLTRWIEATIDAIDQLEPEEAAELAPLAAEVPRIYGRAFEIMVERTLASVAVMMGRAP